MRAFLLLLVFCLSVPSVGAQALLEAHILGPRAVELTVDESAKPFRSEDLSLTGLDGRIIPIASILPKRADTYLVVPAQDMDPTRLHVLASGKDGSQVFVRRDAWFKTLYSDKPLGAIVSEDRTHTDFRVFAPRATLVRLHLFSDRYGDLDAPDKSIDMNRDRDGVWEATEPGNHHGVYYTYTVHGPDEPGNWFHGTHPVHLTDPYALVSDDSFGKARVWIPDAPPVPVKGGRPSMEDVIAYEVHVQDFTDALPVADHLKGTFSAMAMPGLKNEDGHRVGFDYLVDLGINVVHLMPVQEYLHYPDAEWQAAFADNPYMIEQDIARENYQWGYRTTHALAVESRFRDRRSDRGLEPEPGEERRQFKQLVQAFHEKGISVIIDVVPNHTGENMDGRHLLLNFNGFDLPYYHRTDDSLRHIGPFGNEIKSEERPMVQRWILDQLRHWVEVLGVDGFRIDLAGQIDEQTLLWIKSELPSDLIIYGEAWIPPSDPEVASDPDFGWYKADSPITYFQDDARNAFKGPVSDPINPLTDRGFAGGDGSVRERAVLGLTNGWAEEGDPNRGINYLDIHDNWTLADQFSNEDWNGLLHVDEKAFRIAATLLFTSLGPIVLHGGTEIMRSKGHAPLEEVVRWTETGPLYFHGKRDSYNLRRANRFLWDTVGATTPMDYAGMLAYWKGLVELRLSHAGSVFRMGGSSPDEGHYDFITPDNTQLLGYRVGDEVFVLMNTSFEDAEFHDLPPFDGAWRLVADGNRIDLTGLGEQTLSGTIPFIPVPAQTALVWVRNPDN
ncbi:MAG: alpha-amylase family glycosyl hydrolase [Rhodothermales bacterium]